MNESSKNNCPVNLDDLRNQIKEYADMNNTKYKYRDPKIYQYQMTFRFLLKVYLCDNDKLQNVENPAIDLLNGLKDYFEEQIFANDETNLLEGHNIYFIETEKSSTNANSLVVNEPRYKFITTEKQNSYQKVDLVSYISMDVADHSSYLSILVYSKVPFDINVRYLLSHDEQEIIEEIMPLENALTEQIVKNVSLKYQIDQDIKINLENVFMWHENKYICKLDN